MRNFLFCMDDDRCTVPHVIFVAAANEDRAKELASRELLKSHHHLSIEVREGGALCYRLGRNGSIGLDGPIEA